MLTAKGDLKKKKQKQNNDSDEITFTCQYNILRKLVNTPMLLVLV